MLDQSKLKIEVIGRHQRGSKSLLAESLHSSCNFLPSCGLGKLLCPEGKLTVSWFLSFFKSFSWVWRCPVNKGWGWKWQQYFFAHAHSGSSWDLWQASSCTQVCSSSCPWLCFHCSEISYISHMCRCVWKLFQKHYKAAVATKWANCLYQYDLQQGVRFYCVQLLISFLRKALTEKMEMMGTINQVIQSY